MKVGSKQRWLAGGFSVVTALFILKGAVAQYGPAEVPNAPGTAELGQMMTLDNSTSVAVANDVNQHIHSIALRASDVTSLITSLGSGGTVTVESSEGYDGGVPNGQKHTHTVTLSVQQLQQLQSTGSLTVQSSTALNHSHNFTFLMPTQCAGGVPVPGPGTPTPTVTPSVKPSASPSPSPSASPSPSPKPSPSPVTSTSPNPVGTFTPITLPTITIPTIPFPFRQR
jgi:hypothetical protein